MNRIKFINKLSKYEENYFGTYSNKKNAEEFRKKLSDQDINFCSILSEMIIIIEDGASYDSNLIIKAFEEYEPANMLLKVTKDEIIKSGFLNMPQSNITNSQIINVFGQLNTKS